MYWNKVTIRSIASEIDDLEALLWDLGAVSVTITDQQDNPIYEPGPGETPLWQELNVAALFEQESDVAHIVTDTEAAGFEVVLTEELGDRHWEREWMSRFEPMSFGSRLWVCPSGREVIEPGAVVMLLDPGLAFGTGTHATTRLCLRWLDQADLKDKRVLDYGSGSGILGIAALLLGAARVIAVDTDPQALTATRDNAENNGVADRVTTLLPEEFTPGPYDLVLANILAKPLIDLSGMLTGCLAQDADIVLSGIMTAQQSWVEKAYQDRVTLVGQSEDDGWICLHGKWRVDP